MSKFKYMRMMLFHGTDQIKQYLFGAGGNNYGEGALTPYFAGITGVHPFSQPFALMYIPASPSSLPYTVGSGTQPGEVVYQGASLATATAIGNFISYDNSYHRAFVSLSYGAWNPAGGSFKGVTHTTSTTYANMTGGGSYNTSINPDIWKSISLRFQTAIGVKSDSTLWLAGSNIHYQLGTGDQTNLGLMTQTSPGGHATGWVKCASGDEFLAALDSSGNIWTVGNNNIAAQVHNGTYTGAGVPAAVTNGDVSTWYNTSTCTTVNHPAKLHVTSPSGAFTVNEHIYQGPSLASCTWRARVLMHDTTNGFMWISSTSGTMTTGSFTGNSSGLVGSITSTTTTPPVFKDLQVGHRYVAAIDEDQHLWTWGNNGGSRELGRLPQYLDATAPDYTQQTQDLNCRFVNYPGSDPWPGRFLNVYPGAYHAAAISTDGNIYGWGANQHGQLGSGVGLTDGNPPFAIAVPGSGSGHTFVAGDLGTYHSMFIRDDGTLWACGQNNTGQCGVGSTTDVTSGTSGNVNGMVMVANPTTGQWAQVAAGDTHTLAIDTNGYLWGWGANAAGTYQLGLATVGNYTVPTLLDNTRNWSLVTAGYHTSIALALT